MTLFINYIAFIVLNIAMAWYHARLIKEDKRIRHGLWAAGYLAAVGIFSLLFSWWYFPALVFLRGCVFSPALNLFRGLPIDYISASTTSIIDRLEYRAFGRSWPKRMIFYAAGLIICTVVLIFFKG
jgi:hypothetical protein